MNVLALAGHIGNDADVRVTQTGTAITSFSVPVDKGWGENKTTTWVKCVMFGKKGTGEPHGLSPYLTKGRFVAVTGEMSLSEWESKGVKHAMVECTVRDVSLGPEKAEAKQAAAPKPAPAPEPAFTDDSIPF